MTTPNPSWPERITINPEVCNGKPTVRGTRITAQTVLEFLGAGDSPEEILAQYPALELADIHACMAAAARIMDRQYVVKRTA